MPGISLADAKVYLSTLQQAIEHAEAAEQAAPTGSIVNDTSIAG